jgi:hypothetical protein
MFGSVLPEKSVPTGVQKSVSKTQSLPGGLSVTITSFNEKDPASSSSLIGDSSLNASSGTTSISSSSSGLTVVSAGRTTPRNASSVGGSDPAQKGLPAKFSSVKP